MPDQLEPDVVRREISDLEMRIGELRQAAAVPEPDLRATLSAAMVELDVALTSLRSLGDGTAGRSAPAADEERRLLRTIFQDAPVALFLLDRDGDVRRVNRQAAQLLGTSAGYVSGRPFPIFCDLPSRATLRSHLATVVRTGERRDAKVRFLGGKAPVEAVVTLVPVQISGDPDPMVVAAAAGESPRAPVVPVPDSAADAAVAAVLHRMDVLATSTELLLDEPLLNEAVALRRCARLLAAELSDWAFIDVVTEDGGDSGLRRQVVFGPAEERAAEVARVVERLDPRPGDLPATVHANRQPSLHALVEELDLLGTNDDGVAVCGLMGATSVLCVPIDDGERCVGAITLASSGESGPFDLTDLGVVQRLGRHLGLIIRAARRYQRSTEVSHALQASLLPRELPRPPGLEVAATYLAAAHGVEIGGDFYDVFPTRDGWGMVLGDVCGKGEAAAAVTATARHGIRQLSRWKEEPEEVLTMVNESLMDEERYVTAVYATLSESRSTARIGTAGHPPAIVIRADGAVRTTEGGGVPLGLFDDFAPSVESVDLAEGDTLLLHSDGVLDACNAMRERFGTERLIEVLAAHGSRPVGEMLAAVERRLQEFCEGELDDDVSMLALRVLPPSLD